MIPAVSNGKPWTSFVLGAATLLLLGTLWFGLHSPPPAYGQIPDSGAQRAAMVAELQKTNQKLTQILGVLREISAKTGEAGASKSAKKP